MNGNQSVYQGHRGRTIAFRHGLKLPKLSSTVVVFMALSLLGLYLAAPAGALGSSSFVGTDGTLDAGAAGLMAKDDEASGSGDDSFAEGVHEDTAVPPIETGGVPDKADLKTFHMAIEKAGAKTTSISAGSACPTRAAPPTWTSSSTSRPRSPQTASRRSGTPAT